MLRWFAFFALTVRVAHADVAVDKTAAERLFEDGRNELSAGRAEAACAKFEQSIVKDPRAIGTLMNLGLCNERQGKLATALERFLEAFDRASEASQPELATVAHEHIVELRTKAPVVAISYAGPALPGERLVIDSRVVPRERGDLVLDPGPHTVLFSASDRLPYEVSLVVRAATRVPLRLPLLEPPKPSKNPRRFVAKLVTFTGVGTGALAAGLAFYARYQYRSQFDGTMPHCGSRPPIDGRPACDGVGQQAVDNARRTATVATVVGIAGLAIAATGVGLWLTSPTERVHIEPAVTTDRAVVMVSGSF